MKENNQKISHNQLSIRLEGVTKIFYDKKDGRETRAVDNFNVTFPDGKLVGLLGPSGCGKSTTLYMIAGLHAPTEGKIFFGDEDVTELSPEKRGIGLVFQNYALYPHMTIRQNIAFPLENINLRKVSIEEAYKEAYFIESPEEAKVYYKYLNDLDALKDKYRRLETEAKNEYESTVKAAKEKVKEEVKQLRADGLRDEAKELRSQHKIELAKLKDELKNKISPLFGMELCPSYLFLNSWRDSLYLGSTLKDAPLVAYTPPIGIKTTPKTINTCHTFHLLISIK